MDLSEAQKEALEEVYTTLRTLQHSKHSEMDPTLGFYCSQGVSMLVDAFPYLTELEQRMDELEAEK